MGYQCLIIMKKILLIGLFFYGLLNFSFAQDNTDNVLVHYSSEQRPEFPGGMEKLYQFIGENIKYPELAEKQRIEGRVIVKFVVQKDGSIANVEVLKSPHESLSEEAIRVMQIMPKWIPGKVNGEFISVYYTLPFTFKLEDEPDNIVNSEESKLTLEELDEKPEFPGGLDGLQKFLNQNLIYPQEMQKLGFQGRVIVQFIVETDGSVSNIYILNSPHPAFSEEAIRVIKKMPKWKPGMKDGEPVNFQFILPIYFKFR